jgi:hypothetical protein
MRGNHRGLLSGFAVIASVVLIAGCAAAPVAEPGQADPTTEPVAEETSDVAALSIGGTAITAFDDEGSVVTELDYTGAGADAIVFLSDVFGSEPAVAPRPAYGSCTAEATTATWGDDDFVLVYDFVGRTGHPDGQTLVAHAKSDAVGDVGVKTAQGMGVGDPVADLEAAIPNVGIHVDLGDPSITYVDYDVVSGVYEDWSDPDFGMTNNVYWGAQAEAKDGLIVKLSAPVWFQSAC